MEANNNCVDRNGLDIEKIENLEDLWTGPEGLKGRGLDFQLFALAKFLISRKVYLS